MNNLEAFPIIKAKALVVQHDADWFVYFNDLIKSNDFFEFHFAKNKKEALELIKQEPFQLILLDLFLPDGQYTETIEAISRVVPNIPIVVMTSIDDSVLQEDVMQTGIEDYLIKGAYDEKLFFHVVHQAIRRCLVKNEHIKSLKEKVAELERYCTSIQNKPPIIKAANLVWSPITNFVSRFLNFLL